MAKKQETETEAPRALTEYVVLEAIDFRPLIDEQDALTNAVTNLGLAANRADFTAWLPVLNQTAEQGPDGEVRVFAAPGKSAAIRQHTGDGADVIEGTWKAVPVSSWKGGEVTRRVTATERLPLEDAVA